MLEATCEPVGHAEIAPQPGGRADDMDGASALPIRADWSEHIRRCLNGPPGSGRTAAMLDQLKWANREEYERGISRLWLRRVEKEGELGAVKRTVAERYVLACVISNRWVGCTHAHTVACIFICMSVSASAGVGCQRRRWRKTSLGSRLGPTLPAPAQRTRKLICTSQSEWLPSRSANRCPAAHGEMWGSAGIITSRASTSQVLGRGCCTPHWPSCRPRIGRTSYCVTMGCRWGARRTVCLKCGKRWWGVMRRVARRR